MPVRGEASYLKTKNMKMCWLFRAVDIVEGRDR
jgi:hypothetical protein